MKRRVVVPKAISAAIRSFGLNRQLLVALLSAIHDDLPSEAEQLQPFRSDEERCFLYTLLLNQGAERHRFDLTVDDVTSSEHFIIDGITHIAD